MGSSILIPPNTFEPYVDSLRAAEFLAMSRKTLLELARKGRVPAHPVGQGVRKPGNSASLNSIAGCGER